ncbi:MAG: sulfatase [Deltaproteobacteria bacterium]|jgi:arylsulfatase A-like enzyme|nr:sulfatase [Deltaproteobacteria bacterium]
MKYLNRRKFLQLTGYTTASALLPGCSRIMRSLTRRAKNFGPARHVIVISLDTTRPDHFGCYGNPWMRTPRFDALADESILFTDYMTVVPTTLASHTALFTGKYPHSHGTPRNAFIVNEHNIMLPEILKRAGFYTAGFLGAYPLSSHFSFNQGFDHYDENFGPGKGGKVKSKRTAQSVTDAVIAYLEKTGIAHNLFLFIHYWDPHTYTPPPPYYRMYQDNDAVIPWLALRHGKRVNFRGKNIDKALAYAGEISYMDEHFGRLVDYMKKRGILDESVVLITSDHGENFKEHFQNWNHGHTVFQSTMQAVGMIRLPHAEKAGTKVKQLFTSIDNLPTLLKYLGLDIPDGVEGEPIDLTGSDISFPPRVRFGQATKPHRRVETDTRWYNIRKARCIRDGNIKYIQTPYEETEELYDLSVDPYERHNLLKKPPPKIVTCAAALRQKLEEWANSAHPLPSEFITKKQAKAIERLKSLGYLQ